MSDELYIRRCLQLASLGLGNVSPNPLVGCCIVNKGRIIGEGYHEVFGGPHAEVNALSSVSQYDLHLLPESTLYVNLEPCSHTGKTPPCADLIISKKLKRVVVGMIDPNPSVQGRGIQRIKDTGIEVSTGILESECKKLNKWFVHNISTNRAYCILKFAVSRGGFIGQGKGQIQISNDTSNRLVHQLRADVDAILIGAQTAIIDNPNLTTRLVPGSNPTRVLVDLKNRVGAKANIFNDLAKTIVFTKKKRLDIDDIIEQVLVSNDFLQPVFILNQLYQRQIGSVLVEGGGMTLESFMNARCWNEAIQIDGAIRLNQGVSAPRLDRSPDEIIQIDSDRWSVYFNDEAECL